jgi:hypothetical protein
VASRTLRINGGTDRRMRCLRKDGRGASRDGLLRLVLPHQLHEEGLVQEVAGERMAQPPWRAGGKQGPVGEAVGSDEAPPASAVEEGQGALGNRRPTQERKRPCRRAGGSRKERGHWRTKNSTSRSGEFRRAGETRRHERAQTSKCWEVVEWAGCTTWQRGWSTLLRLS